MVVKGGANLFLAIADRGAKQGGGSQRGVQPPDF